MIRHGHHDGSLRLAAIEILVHLATAHRGYPRIAYCAPGRALPDLAIRLVTSLVVARPGWTVDTDGS